MIFVEGYAKLLVYNRGVQYHFIIMSINTRDVPVFGSGTGKAANWLFF